MPFLTSTATGLRPNGVEPDQRLTVDATVGGVQFSTFAVGTSHVLWSTEDASFRVTFDGSAPTTTNGHLVASGSTDVWTVKMAEAAKFIRVSGVSAIVHVSQMAI